MSTSGTRGFTLIEVMIALGILALGLGVLMHAEAASLSAAGRTRGITFATLLARSKMVDVEQHLFNDGFTLGDSEDDGDFADEGHPEIKWKSRVIEVELDLGSAGKLAGGGEDDAGISAMVAGLGGPVEALTKTVAQSMRVVELTVTYPSDRVHFDTIKVRSVVTKDDLGTKEAAAAAAAAAASGAAAAAAGQSAPGVVNPGLRSPN
jgi:prepilin-type N-terminal cleavage/methylation domain-containing protein